jgi:hypothetical protein
VVIDGANLVFKLTKLRYNSDSTFVNSIPMARPQGYKASRTGRATGKGKIGTTIAKGFQPRSRSIENRGSEEFDLPVKLQQQLFVADRSRIG